MLATFYIYFRVFTDKITGYLKYGASKNVERIYGDGDGSGVTNHFYNISIPMDQIDDTIFIGNAFNAADYNSLTGAGITGIVNCTKEISNYFESTDTFQYCKIPILDHKDASLEAYFEPFLRFLDEHISAHTSPKVLIHCYMGSSRSATLVLLYLIIHKKMDCDDALLFLKNKRIIVNINIKFLDDVLHFTQITKEDSV